MKNKNNEYSIVIPVYKSGAWMDELVTRIGAVMEQVAPSAFELILVNDCSPDTTTWPAIKRNAEKYSWVHGFNLLYNVGQFRATICGLQQAQGRFILNMDDDLQHLPEELPTLIRAMNENEDLLCVMGRYETKRHNALRNAGSRFYQKIMNRVYDNPSGIQTTSFRIMKKELVDAILAYRTAKPIMGSMIVSLTRKIKNVPIQQDARRQGSSGYTLWSLVSTTFDNVISASTAPLRFFSVIGFFCSGASLFLAMFYFFRWLIGGIGVAGFTSQILLITFFGGMTLAGIGLLGEYVARIISEITGPERFRIKEETGCDESG
jgi:dolichol-phosphate mannosyltransferase/undecaprenyl-phosphate 4-deoxy-4-formamido-L-arabinose transferase